MYNITVSKKVIIIISVVILVAVGLFFLIKRDKFKPSPAPEPPQTEQTRVVCKRFTSLDEAANNIEIACVLDLSGQALTDSSSEISQISKLNNLTTLILKDNKLTSIPSEITLVKSLITLDLSNNQIVTAPKEIGDLINLQVLILTNNPIPAAKKEEFKKLLPKTSIQF